MTLWELGGFSFKRGKRQIPKEVWGSFFPTVCCARLLYALLDIYLHKTSHLVQFLYRRTCFPAWKDDFACLGTVNCCDNSPRPQLQSRAWLSTVQTRSERMIIASSVLLFTPFALHMVIERAHGLIPFSYTVHEHDHLY